MWLFLEKMRRQITYCKFLLSVDQAWIAWVNPGLDTYFNVFSSFYDLISECTRPLTMIDNIVERLKAWVGILRSHTNVADTINQAKEQICQRN